MFHTLRNLRLPREWKKENNPTSPSWVGAYRASFYRDNIFPLFCKFSDKQSQMLFLEYYLASLELGTKRSIFCFYFWSAPGVRCSPSVSKNSKILWVRMHERGYMLEKKGGAKILSLLPSLKIVT